MTLKNNYQAPAMEQFDIKVEINFMSPNTPNQDYIGENPLGDLE